MTDMDVLEQVQPTLETYRDRVNALNNAIQNQQIISQQQSEGGDGGLVSTIRNPSVKSAATVQKILRGSDDGWVLRGATPELLTTLQLIDGGAELANFQGQSNAALIFGEGDISDDQIQTWLLDKCQRTVKDNSFVNMIQFVNAIFAAQANKSIATMAAKDRLELVLRADRIILDIALGAWEHRDEVQEFLRGVRDQEDQITLLDERIEAARERQVQQDGRDREAEEAAEVVVNTVEQKTREMLDRAARGQQEDEGRYRDVIAEEAAAIRAAEEAHATFESNRLHLSNFRQINAIKEQHSDIMASRLRVVADAYERYMMQLRELVVALSREEMGNVGEQRTPSAQSDVWNTQAIAFADTTRASMTEFATLLSQLSSSQSAPAEGSPSFRDLKERIVTVLRYLHDRMDAVIALLSELPHPRYYEPDFVCIEPPIMMRAGTIYCWERYAERDKLGEWFRDNPRQTQVTLMCCDFHKLQLEKIREVVVVSYTMERTVGGTKRWFLRVQNGF